MTTTFITPMMTLQENGDCGICERACKEDERVGYSNPKSLYAHQECYNLVEPAEKTMNAVIEAFINVMDTQFRDKKYGDDKFTLNDAHIKAFLLIKESVLKEQTIKQYIEDEGIEKYTLTCSTFGILGITMYATDLITHKMNIVALNVLLQSIYDEILTTML